MIDLSQVSLALRNATARSLILLDEFGNGTTPAGYFGFCFPWLNSPDDTLNSVLIVSVGVFLLFRTFRLQFEFRRCGFVLRGNPPSFRPQERCTRILAYSKGYRSNTLS